MEHLAVGTVDAGTEGKIGENKVICAILIRHTTESYYHISRVELQCCTECSEGGTMINIGIESLNNGSSVIPGDNAALKCGAGKVQHGFISKR